MGGVMAPRDICLSLASAEFGVCDERTRFSRAGAASGNGGVRIDELNGFSGHGASPLVVLPGQSAGVAQVARTVADPRCAHFGRK